MLSVFRTDYNVNELPESLQKNFYDDMALYDGYFLVKEWMDSVYLENPYSSKEVELLDHILHSSNLYMMIQHNYYEDANSCVFIGESDFRKIGIKEHDDIKNISNNIIGKTFIKINKKEYRVFSMCSGNDKNVCFSYGLSALDNLAKKIKTATNCD